ncbi:MAG TPA: hypothetical protein PKH40_12640, partial [Treponemataceae bacterium]|nr:hypothetical protein [Treponemataceae bacterium]
MANKSFIKALIALIVSLVSLFVSSCSMDLEPSWKKGTTLSIEMGTATIEQSRALLTQSGYLYICPDSKILGPYDISAGTRFSTTDVEPGTYKTFILVYASYKIDSAILEAAMSGADSFIDSLSRDVLGRASWGALRDVTIQPSMDNVVALTLVPAVSSGLVIDMKSGEAMVPVVPVEGETSVSRFIRIDNPLSTTVESTPVGLEISIDANTSDGPLPQANLPTVIPAYTGDGKPSSVFTLKGYASGIADYTGVLPSVNAPLYISVSFTSSNASGIHVKLVQKFDKPVDPVDPVYSTFMTVNGVS